MANSPSYLDELYELLVRHEGLKLRPYKCTAGHLTIGVGRNLDDNGISKEEALAMLVNDIDRVQIEAVKNCKKYPFLNDARKVVILSMIFNLGLTRFLKFEKFNQALNVDDYSTAANEMRNSLWAGQVGERAEELAKMMGKGEFINFEAQENPAIH